MLSLCGDAGGQPFGPHSSIHPNLPTFCFCNVVVIPLPVWIYLLVAPVLILFGRRKTRDTKEDTSKFRRKGCCAKTLIVIYYLLIVAMVAMESLEIARLSVAHLGIGLLPFVYVGVILAALIHALFQSGISKFVGAAFWILLAAAMAIKLAGMVEQEGPKYNRIGINSKYPLGDEVTDVGTMIGVEIVLALLEIFT